MSLVDRLSHSGPGWQPFWDRRKSQTTFGERTFAKFRNKNAVFVNFCNKNVIFFNYPIPDDSENILGIARKYRVGSGIGYPSDGKIDHYSKTSKTITDDDGG